MAGGMHLETFGLIIGGIGLFLLGMNLMTEGLKAMAGEKLKDILRRFTGGVYSAILSGAVITGVIQSSSAATFMTIGFVSAGLLSFSQSLGVIIGANIGSTSTGWIVSVIGFQINMSMLALPLIGGGVLLRLISKNKWGPQGSAVTGFGLLFLGIDVLQNGMSGFTAFFDLSRLQGESWWWLPLLIGIGFLMTVVMQSSSAAVVTTLTALHTGAVDFNQAALLVIGQNVGTTVKAFLASIGGTTAARRTAAGHILFNLITGLLAVVLLPVLVSFVMLVSEVFSLTDEAVQLAVFHTVFNLLGVVFILMIYPYFKIMVKRLIPERKTETYLGYLDESVAELGPVAVEALRRTLRRMMRDCAAVTSSALNTSPVTFEGNRVLNQVETELVEMQKFLTKVSLNEPSASSEAYEARVSLVHAMDHTDRWVKALREGETYQKALKEGQTEKFVYELQKICSRWIKASETAYTEEEKEEYGRKDPFGGDHQLVSYTEAQASKIAGMRKETRREVLAGSVKDELTVDDGIRAVQTVQWIDRLAYHMWRAAFHTQNTVDSKEKKDQSL
ncbi:Na/Pi cotransporter family protein [Alkalicoccus saliphilus]|uniref:Na/Pi cotransporter family protein n=1 Tax=Alkalicoccus saliphilus TaxID=200989 RepID=UPI00135CF106|nr:Na/Pi symporter [Alkalicoccus saliphilus]